MTEGHQGFWFSLGSRFQDHTGTGHLLQPRVRNTDHLDLVHCWMLEQQSFNFDRIDVFSTHFEHFFVPAEKTDRFILAHDRHIAAMEPALSIDCLSCFFWFFIVTLHYPIPTATELSGSAIWHGVSRRGIDDLKLISW